VDKNKYNPNQKIPVSYKNTGEERLVTMSGRNNGDPLDGDSLKKSNQLSEPPLIEKFGNVVDEMPDSGGAISSLVDVLNPEKAESNSVETEAGEQVINSDKDEDKRDIEHATSKNEFLDTKSLKKVDKKKEPQSLTEYLELFYQGKIKNLPETFVFRMTGTFHDFRPDERSALQQGAMKEDVSLDKTLLLMQIACSARSNPILETFLLDFAKDIVAFHPVVKSSELGRAVLFPLEIENAKSLQDIWSLLYKGAKESKSSKKKKNKTTTGSNPDVESDSDSESKLSSDAKNSLSKDLSKARKNAFFCAVLWRRIEGESVSSMMRVLQDTFLLLKKEPANFDDELLENIFSLSNLEAERFSLFAKWANRNVNEKNIQLERMEQSVSASKAENEYLANESAVQQATIVQMSSELLQLRNSLIEVQNEIAIQKVHTRADFEELRSRSLGVLKKEVAELENVEIALSRTIPKVETAKDVVSAVVDSLQTYIRDLEAKR